jgi:hypothetical protein
MVFDSYFVFAPIYESNLFIYLLTYLFIYLFIYIPIIYLPTYLFIYIIYLLYTYPFISIYLST